jgi:CDP-diacylglycerol--serine O-phosphatidyltransferase
MQLDSLADVVCFGVAPAVLMTEYMSGTHAPSPIVWFSAVVFVLCSALRLARYNTTIADDVLKDSFGLPTTVAGSFLALLVYLDYETSGKILALWFIPFAAISLGALMVSKIRFISKTGNTKLTVLSLAATAILGIFVSLPLAGLVFLSIHTAHGLSRAVWRWWRRVRQTQQDKKRLTHPPLF